MHILVQKHIAQQRYDICKTCPRFTELKLCSVCNCVMPIKVKFAYADCPLGRWKINTDKDQHTGVIYENLD